MKRFKNIVTILLAMPFALFAFSAAAHTLKTDGDIGAIMHVDPEDDPAAGQPATFYFEITDRTKKFDPANCNCTFEVLQDGKQIFSQPLFLTGEDNPAAPAVKYTFNQKGVYDIVLQGVPKQAGQFQSFKIDYDWRVDRVATDAGATDSSQKPYNHTFHYIIIGAGVLIAFGMIGYDYYENRDYYNKKWFGK